MKKRVIKYFFFVCALLFGIAKSSTLYSQNSKQEATINYTINESWKFSQVDSKDNSKNNIDTKAWSEVSMPHTWNAKDAIDDVPGFFQGPCWYRKDLFIGNESLNKRVVLHFDGANQVTELYVNENYVGKHNGGYSAFEFDITSLVISGSKNTIAIRVDNSINPSIPPLSADFTFFGGIYRGISLLISNKSCISYTEFASSGVLISTPIVSDKEASVEVKTNVNNFSAEKRKYIIKHELISPDGIILSVVSKSIEIVANANTIIVTSPFKIEKPKLWSPDAPFLYSVKTTLSDAKTKIILDQKDTSFGVRWYEFTADKGFFLNGKPLKLIGTNRHQCYKGIGNALPDEIHVRDIMLIKNMGANFLRVSHYPQDPLVLSLCDKLGIVTMVEIPIVNAITTSDAFLNNSLKMIDEMVYQNYNHPSVVCWGYMNEVLLRLPFKDIPEKNIAYCKEVNRQATVIEKRLRELDPKRYTIIPCHGALKLYKEAGLLGIPKIIGWNLYQGWYSPKLEGFEEFVDDFHKEYPKTPFLITEYGADVDERLHSYTPERFDYTVEYGAVYQEHYLKTILDRDFISGATLWNLNDFHSEYRGAAVPHVNKKGIVSQTRELKDTYLLYQAHLLKSPFIAFGSKSWIIRAGVSNDTLLKQPITVYTNLPKITLTCNGKELGDFTAENGIVRTNVFCKSGENKLWAFDKNNNQTQDFYSFDCQVVPAYYTDKNVTDLNIMLGSNRYFEDKDAAVCWIPEQEYTKAGSWGYVGGEALKVKTKNGTVPASDLNILNTENDPIFQTQRINIKEFKADLPDGNYYVYLYFTHLFPINEKQTLANNLDNVKVAQNSQNFVFDILINGQLWIKDFDILNQIGSERSVIKKSIVSISEGKGLTVSFNTKGENKSILNAIRIEKVN
ncbi:glycoside hydrolase family 2 TIM barrel-domain containing protein [Flavobacterium sp. N1994]|uniref:glycoside hydrolase family 2 TIM barrel-domain containing protein n=1 Tax=Flavobacterium sp. N1994 TaxID=2986827 RepID=UPI0022229AF2|nr:glycoside hydrolase family 2 TIM barrel-domain containing protein [Flavobacterium sp. N1994]